MSPSQCAYVTGNPGQENSNKLPNRKCCMMGTLDKTSTWYILSSPEFTCTQHPHTAHQQPVLQVQSSKHVQRDCLHSQRALCACLLIRLLQGSHLCPTRHGADVIQHGRRLSQGPLLHLQAGLPHRKWTAVATGQCTGWRHRSLQHPAPRVAFTMPSASGVYRRNIPPRTEA